MKLKTYNATNVSDSETDDYSVSSETSTISESKKSDSDSDSEPKVIGYDKPMEVEGVEDNKFDGDDCYEDAENFKGGSKDDAAESDDDGPAVVKNEIVPVLDSDDEDDDEMDESYLQKFNSAISKNYIMDFHPECTINNYDEVAALTKIVRDADNNIIDDLHVTIPYLTKYEKARVLGQRAKQINSGAKVFVKVPENIIDGYLIAEMELAQKRVPFIIRRPTPGGGCEYWNLKDLELIQF